MAPTATPTSLLISLSPSEYFERRYEAVRDVLLQVSTEETLDDVSSPQHATMEWIVETDQAQIPPTDEEVLLTRYIVSLLYFALKGDEWWQDFGFLDPSNICTWNDGGNNGCYCVTNGTEDILTEIGLCTSPDVACHIIIGFSNRFPLSLSEQLRTISMAGFPMKFSFWKIWRCCI
jgi:hypothetical protein